ncbi:ABC transporter permease [Nocardia asteroides]|uniref:ABC transporter permease n=1 Tax=Nocardia asteroides TaxID=1824 RepID=UPI001E2FB5F7|nr:ABC-2 family transporter protein [Nocardia asteroides]UGT63033.1 ABC-2 family transporter protein [Nocardia asteroides]
MAVRALPGLGGAMVYRRLAVAGFRRQWQYKLALFAGMFTNSVFGLLRGAVMLAAIGSAGSFGGYDAGSISAYVWLSQALLGAVLFTDSGLELGERVRSGDIAVDFLRPVDLQLATLAGDLGRATCTLLPRGLPTLAVGALVYGGLDLPNTPAPYLLGIVSVLLGTAISSLALFGTAMIGFWVVETRGLRTLHQVLGSFLAGLFVPVHLFPGWLGALAAATPFPSVLQAPVDVLSGRVTGTAALAVVGVQLFWVLAMAALGQALLAAGRRKLEVQGG